RSINSTQATATAPIPSPPSSRAPTESFTELLMRAASKVTVDLTIFVPPCFRLPRLASINKFTYSHSTPNLPPGSFKGVTVTSMEPRSTMEQTDLDRYSRSHRKVPSQISTTSPEGTMGG